jgi:hypothetical protein
MSDIPRLRSLPIVARLSLTCLMAVLGGGYLASGFHMREHHQGRDGQDGLAMTDLRGVYHGVDMTSPLIGALEAGHPGDLDGQAPLPAFDKDALLAWLRGERIVADWDNMDLGDAVPADILDLSCAACHSRSAATDARVEPMLDNIDDIRAHAVSSTINPLPRNVLLATTHTHAIALGTITLVVVLLLCACRWKRPAQALGFVASAGLLFDLAGWWLARGAEAWVPVIVGAGALHALAVGLGLLLVVAELWLPGGGKT